jgi:hypothetical protein
MDQLATNIEVPICRGHWERRIGTHRALESIPMSCPFREVAMKEKLGVVDTWIPFHLAGTLVVLFGAIRERPGPRMVTVQVYEG